MKSMGDLLKRAIGQSEKLPPKYWTEGWNKFSFLMTPEQVKEVFEAYHLIIINSSVPIDYVESELSEYLSAYSETYKQLCSGEKVTTCSLDLWRGITSNLARCRYGEIRLRDGKQYKRATFDEPVVAVVPGRLGLGRYDDGKLFCSTAYTMVTLFTSIAPMTVRANSIGRPTKPSWKLYSGRPILNYCKKRSGMTISDWRYWTISAEELLKRRSVSLLRQMQVFQMSQCRQRRKTTRIRPSSTLWNASSPSMHGKSVSPQTHMTATSAT